MVSLKASYCRSLTGAFAALAIGASVLGNMAVSVPAANADAATSGPGYLVKNSLPSSPVAYHWAGAFEGPDGKLAWCVEAGKISSRPTAYSGQIDNKQLAAALSLYEGVSTADSRAALSLLVRENADIGPEWQSWVDDIQAAHPAVQALANQYWADAAAYAGDYTIDSSDPVTTDGGKTYTVDNVTIRSAGTVTGYKVTASIPDDSPATFDDGSKSQTIDSGGSVTVKATGFGTIHLNYSATDLPGNGPMLTYRESERLQTMLVAPAPATATGETTISDKAKPVITTVADAQVVKPGDPVIDNVTLSLSGSDQWITDKDGKNASITATGTLYGPFPNPVGQADHVPEGAPVVGYEALAFDHAGTMQTSGNLKATTPGFYTWVWKIEDSESYERYQTPFAEYQESSVVKHEINHQSKAREYTVNPGGQAFDQITINDLPEDHGQFSGTNSGWKADLATAHVTVYGPLASEPSTADVPADAPVFGRFDIEAKNGTFQIGDDDATKVTVPDNGYGYYAFVYSFDGDDRVAPFQSAFNDKDEQFYVPAPDVTITTQATPTIKYGEKAHDTALVSGTLPKNGANLSFKAYYAQKDANGNAICQPSNEAFSTNYGKITSAGSFESEETVFDRPGDYYWVETLVDDSGAVLHSGECGLTNETTTVEENKPAPASAALARTGANALPFLGAGIVLAGVAGGLIIARRRRRPKETASE